MKCPKCDGSITTVNATPIEAAEGFMTAPKWRCIAYCCPVLSCQAVLSVEMNPLRLQEDLLRDLKKLLGRA